MNDQVWVEIGKELGPWASVIVLTLYASVTIWNRRSNGKVAELIGSVEKRLSEQITSLQEQTSANCRAIASLQACMEPIERERREAADDVAIRHGALRSRGRRPRRDA